jgi:hypothetical protein
VPGLSVSPGLSYGIGLQFQSPIGGSGLIVTNDLLPSLNLDFVNYPGASIAPLTFTRASAGTYFNSSGVLQTSATDVARFDNTEITGTSPLGLLIEEARTNVVLWNRDLTNAAWTASSVTVAKTATGIDGVANSASTLTATAGNGTVLQAITLASSARFQSAWVKRRTGTGTINMTMDNGSTWTAITVTSSWSRLSIPTQTLANPTVGFRIVTSGDAIDVDYVQNENGTFATSSIATTTASVTRAADVCSILTSAFPFNAAEGTIVVGGRSASAISGAQNFYALNDGGANNRMSMFLAGDGARNQVVSGGVLQADIFQAIVGASTVFKHAFAYSANDCASSLNGATATTDTSVTLPTVNSLQLGARMAGPQEFCNGHIQRIAYYPRRLSNTQLQALSA